jgi:hypothetical protein
LDTKGKFARIVMSGRSRKISTLDIGCKTVAL